jgi:transposase
MKMNSLSKHRIKKIINCFAAELTAIDTAQKLKIHRNTVNKYYRFIREAIAQYQEVQLQSNLTADATERYFIAWHRNTGLTLVPETDTMNYSLVVINSKVYVPAQKPGEANGSLLSENQATENISPNQSIAQYFYNYAKTKLTKFYGIRPQYADLYIKELEFRFNNQDSNLAALIWKVVSQTDKQTETVAAKVAVQ